MKFVTKLFLPTFFFTCGNLFGQILVGQNKFDSSFTFSKKLRQDKPGIGQRGVFFNESTSQVLKDSIT